MSAPEFTAEASIYRASTHFQLAQSCAESLRGEAVVIPQAEVCSSTGAVYCQAPIWYCQYQCQDCNGLVCSQPFFRWVACGSCQN